MTRPVGNGDRNGPFDEAFDRQAAGALKEQADTLLFNGLVFDERLRTSIRARAAEGPAGRPGGSGGARAGAGWRRGRWPWLGAVSAAAAVLVLAFRLVFAPAGWQPADRFAAEAAPASEGAPAGEEVPAEDAGAASYAKVAPEGGGAPAAAPAEAPAEAPASEPAAAAEEPRAAQDPEATLAQAERSVGFHVLRPTVLPSGAALERADYDPLHVRQVYRLPGGATLEIGQSEGGLVDRNDPAHPANRGAERVSVNGAEGWLIRSRSAGVPGGWASVTWHQDRFQLSVGWSRWDVPLEELLRIAASLR